MVVITKNGKGQATVQVNGQTVRAQLDPTTRRWEVQLPTGSMWTNSPKLHSIGTMFGQPVSINGAVRTPGAPRPARAPRAPRVHPRTGRRGGPAFAPKTDPKALGLDVLAKLEDAVVSKFAGSQPTADQEKTFDRYQKVKAHALGAGTTSPEAATALRLAIIEIVKLAF